MGKVWITEKPSAAKDLAEGLCLAFKAKSERKSNGLIELSNGDVVLPLAGHVLSTTRPNTYLSKAHAEIHDTRDYARFREFLPLCPIKLTKEPRHEVDSRGKDTGKLFAPYVLAAKVLKNAKQIVNAGDIDREGQLIVDELLLYLGIDPYGPNIMRFGTTSNRREDIADALKLPLDRNGDDKWRLRCDAAQTRQYLDYTWGMTHSMVAQAIVAQSAQQKPGSAAVSVGRVQTPVLAIVNDRDMQIKNFVPVRYYIPVVTLKDGTKMRWFKREGCEGQPGFDLQGRLIDGAVARQIVARINGGAPWHVSKSESVKRSEKPPLPFSMGTLQATAARELGMTLDEVQDVAKALYGKHKAISYIGTDCKFLPESMHGDAPNILRALGTVFPKAAPGADHAIVSQAFNDAKLDEHYAIVPTGQLPSGASADEMGVFRIISKRFIAQFYPDSVSEVSKIEGISGQDHFQCTESTMLRLGWKEVEGQAEGESGFNSGAQNDEAERDQYAAGEAYA